MFGSAKNCFDCGATFKFGSTAINVAITNGLAIDQGLCNHCVVKEREWVCEPCNEKISYKMAFTRPKCGKCNSKMKPLVPKTIEEAKVIMLENEENLKAINEKVKTIIVTTSGNIEGKLITCYKGLVIGSAVARGRNPTDDISSNSLLENVAELWVDSIMAKAMQVYLEKATKDAEHQIKLAAVKLGANAVIGVDIDFVGSKIMQIHMNGTAVVIE